MSEQICTKLLFFIYNLLEEFAGINHFLVSWCPWENSSWIQWGQGKKHTYTLSVFLICLGIFCANLEKSSRSLMFIVSVLCSFWSPVPSKHDELDRKVVFWKLTFKIFLLYVLVIFMTFKRKLLKCSLGFSHKAQIRIMK